MTNKPAVNTPFDYIVYIGRFQILHNGHLATIKKALSLSKRVIVVIGSANLPRTVKNPFTASERADFIKMCLPDEDLHRINFVASNDYLYNDQRWVTDIQTRITGVILEKKAKVGIIGMKKDDSSYYLDMFPQWEFIAMTETKLVHATEIREKYFEGVLGLYPYENDVNPHIVKWLFSSFIHKPEYFKLKQEYDFIKKYKEQWKSAPYPVTFVTTDAVVIQSGHVLMIKRGAQPGEGLYALPGGFIGMNESIQKSMIRELKEETSIKLPIPVLEGHIKDEKVFDHPSRSSRGRTITHAFLIELPAGPLAKVKGGDDASQAFWLPLEDVESKRDMLFEDHADIITYFLGRL